MKNNALLHIFLAVLILMQKNGCHGNPGILNLNELLVQHGDCYNVIAVPNNLKFEFPGITTPVHIKQHDRAIATDKVQVRKYSLTLCLATFHLFNERTLEFPQHIVKFSIAERYLIVGNTNADRHTLYLFTANLELIHHYAAFLSSKSGQRRDCLDCINAYRSAIVIVRLVYFSTEYSFKIELGKFQNVLQREFKSLQISDDSSLHDVLNRSLTNQLHANYSANGKRFLFNTCTTSTCLNWGGAINRRIGTFRDFNRRISGEIEGIAFRTLINLLAHSTLDVRIPEKLIDHPTHVSQIWQRRNNAIFRDLYVELLDHNFLAGYAGQFLILPTGSESYNFVTCDGIMKNMFEFYFKPFDAKVWLMVFLVTLFTIPSTIVLLEFIRSDAPKSTTAYICALQLSVLALIDVSLQFARKFQSILNRIDTQIVINTWFFMALVLSTAYKGIIVSKIASPPELKGKYKNGTQLQGFALIASDRFIRKFLNYVKYEKNPQIEFTHMAAFYQCVCFRNDLDFFGDYCPTVVEKSTRLTPIMCSNFSSSLAASIPGTNYININCKHQLFQQKFESYYANGKKILPEKPNMVTGHLHSLCLGDAYVVKSKPEEISSLPVLTFPNTLVYKPIKWASKPFETEEMFAAVLEYTASCKKVGYVDTNAMLDTFLAHFQLAKNSYIYQKGNENFFPGLTGYWYNSYYMLSMKLFEGLQRLYASGIYDIWKKWYYIKNPDYGKTALKMRDIQGKKLQALDMESNILTVFLVWFVFVALAFVIFWREIAAFKVSMEQFKRMYGLISIKN